MNAKEGGLRILMNNSLSEGKNNPDYLERGGNKRDDYRSLCTSG